MLANSLRLLHRGDRVPRLDDSHRYQREPEPVRVRNHRSSRLLLLYLGPARSGRIEHVCFFFFFLFFYAYSRFTYTPHCVMVFMFLLSSSLSVTYVFSLHGHECS